MSHHFNPLASLKLPLSSDGDLVKDAEGTVVAKTRDVTIASALVQLANLGQEPAAKLNEDYAAQEEAKLRMFAGSLGR